jgi:hypothetical protein
MRQYVCESWGVVGVDVLNRSDESTQVLASFRTPGIPDVEFARRIEVPPQAVRRCWVPVRIPRMPRHAQTIAFAGKLIDVRSGSEVVLRAAHEEVEYAIDLRLNHELPVTGIFLRDEDEPQSESAKFAYEAIIALRTARGCSRRLVMISGRHVPPTPETFDGLDQLVLENGRFAEDAASLSTIRDWVNNGGQLWVMLDRLEFADVERLLGNCFSCGLVDRVQLDSVGIQSSAPRPAIQYTPARAFEQPVDFARVVTTDMQITHTVDGWPAAFWRPVGRGRVVFTTVGAKAWIQPQQHRGRWDPETMTDFVPTPQLDDLPLLLPELPRTYSAESLRPYLEQQIGYRVATPATVLAVLGLFCACLLGAGILLARRRRLEHLGWLVPAAAVLASVPLILAGVRSRQAVPPTVGQVQLIEVAEKDSQVTASGLLAVYQPQPHSGPLGVRRGGGCELETSGLQGTLRRMVWTDLDQWQWENLRLPAGVRTASFSRSMVLPDNVVASGTLTDAGFVGQVTGPFEKLADAVIAVPGQPSLAVAWGSDAVTAGPQDVLAPGQHVAGTLLSSEQTRRQEVYRQVLGAMPGYASLVTRPSLLGWTEPLELGLCLPQDTERVGAALWSVPLEIARPDSGATFVIPSPLMTCRVVQGPLNDGVSPLFDTRTGQWLHSTNASRAWLRFQIPPSLLPVEIQRMRLTLQVTAPDRRLQIVRLVDGQVQELFSRVNPIGRYECVLAPPELPGVDPSGGVLVGVVVGDPVDAAAGSESVTWKMDFVHLEIRGRIP